MRTITGSNFDRRWRWRERVGGKVRPSTNGVAALSLLSSSSSHRPINGAPIFRTMLFRLVSCRRPRFGVGRRPSSAEILIGAGVGGDARPSTNGVAVPSSSPLSSCHRRINDALLVLFSAPIFRMMLFRLVIHRRLRVGVGCGPSPAVILIGAGVGGSVMAATRVPFDERHR